MCSGYSDMLPRFHFREEGFIPQAAGSAAYGKLFVVINNKQGLPWLKTTSSPNIHPHSMVTCPWTAPVTDPKVCRPDQNLPQGWLRPLLRLLSSSTSPSVQSCFFHFTSVPQVLISTALLQASYTLVSQESLSQGTPSSNKVAGCVAQHLIRTLPSSFPTRAQVHMTQPNIVRLLWQGVKSKDS